VVLWGAGGFIENFLR
jgi:hypothetical protein